MILRSLLPPGHVVGLCYIPPPCNCSQMISNTNHLTAAPSVYCYCFIILFTISQSFIWVRVTKLLLMRRNDFSLMATCLIDWLMDWLISMVLLQDGAQAEGQSKTKQESAWLFRLWYTFDHKYPSCAQLMCSLMLSESHTQICSFSDGLLQKMCLAAILRLSPAQLNNGLLRWLSVSLLLSSAAVENFSLVTCANMQQNLMSLPCRGWGKHTWSKALLQGFLIRGRFNVWDGHASLREQWSDQSDTEFGPFSTV